MAGLKTVSVSAVGIQYSDEWGAQHISALEWQSITATEKDHPESPARHSCHYCCFYNGLLTLSLLLSIRPCTRMRRCKRPGSLVSIGPPDA